MKEKKRGGCLRNLLIGFGLLILLGACTALFGDTEDTEDNVGSTDGNVEETAETADENAEEDAGPSEEELEERAAMTEDLSNDEAEEAEQAAAEEEKARQQAEHDAKEKEKAEQQAKADAELKEQMESLNQTIMTDVSQFDDQWEEYWQGTMSTVDSMDIYTVYDRLSTLNDEYGALQSRIMDYDYGFLEGDNKDNIDTYTQDMTLAIDYRRDAVQRTMDMVDTGDFAPSSVDSVMATIEDGDVYMMSATANLVEFQHRNELETFE